MCNENNEPVSAEAFARKHPGMMDAMKMVVREELEISQANGTRSDNPQGSFDVGKIAPDLPLVEGDSFNSVRQRVDGFVRIPERRVGLRILGGIDGFSAAHVLTSLLSVAAFIVALSAAKKE